MDGWAAQREDGILLIPLENRMSHPASPLCTRSATIGSWRLHPGHAMGLRPKKTAVLRIFCGQLWVTQGAPAGVTPDSAGDRFLGPGDVMAVAAGTRLVIEPIVVPGDTGPVHFDWAEPCALLWPSRFDREVVSPTRELGAALAQAAGAMARVVRGLLGYSEFLVPGRGQVLSPMESLRS